MSLELTSPAWLLLLPVVAVLLVVARWPWVSASQEDEGTSTARRLTVSPIRRFAAVRRLVGAPSRRCAGVEVRRLAFRFVWLSLLILALAGLTVTRRLDRQAIVFVLDGSASTAGARDAAEAAVRLGIDRKRGDDRAGVVQAAAGARVEEPPSERPLFRRLAAALPTDGSDLAAGLRLAGALLPSGYAGRVVLLSDGRQTVGDAVAAARELAARDVRVDVLPLGGTAQPDLRVEAIDL